MISKINNYQSPSFQGLIVSDSLNANKSFNQIKDIILKNKLDRKRNVDVILDYNNSTDKFYGIISSKKQGIPLFFYLFLPRTPRSDLSRPGMN